MQSTLLLNQGYNPLGTISWQRAITLLFRGKAELVEVYEAKELRSAYLSIKMPAVIRLINKVIKKHNNQQLRFSRINIYTRDGFRCQYCKTEPGIDNLNLDHVIPRSRGGKTEWENICTCCKSCNLKKRDRTPAEAGLTLISKPYKPSWLPIFILKERKNVPNEWNNYLK